MSHDEQIDPFDWNKRLNNICPSKTRYQSKLDSELKSSGQAECHSKFEYFDRHSAKSIGDLVLRSETEKHFKIA